MVSLESFRKPNLRHENLDKKKLAFCMCKMILKFTMIEQGLPWFDRLSSKELGKKKKIELKVWDAQCSYWMHDI
jgi:hypothetical protein